MAEITPVLQCLNGTRLVWAFQHLSHGMAGALCLDRERGQAEIRFSSAYYSNTPLLMHQVSFELPTSDDIVAFVRAFAIEEQAAYICPERLLVIQCEEGRFFVHAHAALFHCHEPDFFYELLSPEARRILTRLQTEGEMRRDSTPYRVFSVESAAGERGRVLRTVLSLPFDYCAGDLRSDLVAQIKQAKPHVLLCDFSTRHFDTRQLILDVRAEPETAMVYIFAANVPPYLTDLKGRIRGTELRGPDHSVYGPYTRNDLYRLQRVLVSL